MKSKKVTEQQKNMTNLFSTMFIHESYDGPRTTILSRIQRAKRDLEIAIQVGNDFLRSWKFTPAVTQQLMEEEFGTKCEGQLFLNARGELELLLTSFDPEPESGSGPVSQDRVPVDVDSLIEFSENPEKMQVASETPSEIPESAPDSGKKSTIAELRVEAESLGIDPTSFGRSKNALSDMIEQVKNTGVVPEDLQMEKSSNPEPDPVPVVETSVDDSVSEPTNTDNDEEPTPNETPRVKIADAISEPEIVNPEVLVDSVETENPNSPPTFDVDSILTQAENTSSEKELDAMIDTEQVDPDQIPLQNLNPDDIEEMPDDYVDTTVYESFPLPDEDMEEGDFSNILDENEEVVSEEEPEKPKKKVVLDLNALDPDPEIDALISNISAEEPTLSIEDLM